MKAITIGLDIAKSVFQVHVEDGEGRIVAQRRLRRSLEYFDQFYEIINNEGKVRREILGKCRDMSYLEQYAH